MALVAIAALCGMSLWLSAQLSRQGSSLRVMLPVATRDLPLIGRLTGTPDLQTTPPDPLASPENTSVETLAAPPLQAILPVASDLLAAHPSQTRPGLTGSVPVGNALARNGAAPVLVFDSGQDPNAPDEASLAAVATGPANAPAPPALKDQAAMKELAARRIDPGNLLARGTLISAALETAIDNSVPGGVRAVITGDVRSAGSKRVLVPQSSRLIGQYRSTGTGSSARTFVIWTRIDRPDGSTIALGGGGGGTDKAFRQSFSQARLQSIVGGGDGRIRTGEPIRVYAAGDVEISGMK